jgi:hypothetical protein
MSEQQQRDDAFGILTGFLCCDIEAVNAVLDNCDTRQLAGNLADITASVLADTYGRAGALEHLQEMALGLASDGEGRQ